MWAKTDMGPSPATQFIKAGRNMVQYYSRKEDAVALLRDLCLTTNDNTGMPVMPKFLVLQGKCPALVSQLCTITPEDLTSKKQNQRDAFDCACFAVMTNFRHSLPSTVSPRGPLSWGYGNQEEGKFHPISGRPLDG